MIMLRFTIGTVLLTGLACFLPSTSSAAPIPQSAGTRLAEASTRQVSPPAATDPQLPAVVRPSLFVQLPSLSPGIIKSVNVREGQIVRAGDLLIQLDDRVAQARLEVASVRTTLTGAVERAKVDKRLAEERLERLQRVVNSGAGRAYELKEAEGAVDQAAATIRQQQDLLDAAEAERQLAEAQLEELKIVAPFDGLVTRIHRKTGAVDPSLVLIDIANLAFLEVELNVSSAKYGQVKRDQTVKLKADRPISGIVEGKVLAVSPIIDSASDTFRCLIQIDNRQRKLPAGFRVTLY